MAAGKHTARQLVQLCLQVGSQPSIKTGPTMRSILEMNPNALMIANALDDERRSPRSAWTTPRHAHSAEGQHRHDRA